MTNSLRREISQFSIRSSALFWCASNEFKLVWHEGGWHNEEKADFRPQTGCLSCHLPRASRGERKLGEFGAQNRKLAHVVTRHVPLAEPARSELQYEFFFPGTTVSSDRMMHACLLPNVYIQFANIPRRFSRSRFAGLITFTRVFKFAVPFTYLKLTAAA